MIGRHYETAKQAVAQLENGFASLAHLTRLFEALRAVFAEAAKNGQGMLTFLV